MSSTPNKRVKEVSNIDRLSEMPDSVIAHILSLLKVDESAITAVLSKRWQRLWTQSPELYFRQGDLTVPDFVSRVHRTLLFRGRDHYLESFWVDFNYTKPFASDVNAWVAFAVNKKVKRVAFLLNTTLHAFHVLPQSMCSNSSVVSLRIKECTFAPHVTIDWPSLTYLCIEEVEVQQQSIEKILAGCPVLSRLTLRKCWGFNSLEIKSKTLFDIKICDRYRGISGSLLEISAPYVKSLTVHLSYPERRKLRLTTILRNVVTASIEFIGCHFGSTYVMNNAKELLGNIHHVKKVKLRGNYVEALTWLAINYGYDQFPQSTLRKSLTIKTDRDELGNIHAILGLLKSSPNLQELVIEGKKFVDVKPYNCTSANGDQASDLLQLKTVIIKNFIAPDLAGEPMLTLVRILLKCSPVLEKIVIYVKEITKISSALDPITILETVLGYPRSSPKASILLR